MSAKDRAKNAFKESAYWKAVVDRLKTSGKAYQPEGGYKQSSAWGIAGTKGLSQIKTDNINPRLGAVSRKKWEKTDAIASNALKNQSKGLGAANAYIDTLSRNKNFFRFGDDRINTSAGVGLIRSNRTRYGGTGQDDKRALAYLTSFDKKMAKANTLFDIDGKKSKYGITAETAQGVLNSYSKTAKSMPNRKDYPQRVGISAYKRDMKKWQARTATDRARASEARRLVDYNSAVDKFNSNVIDVNDGSAVYNEQLRRAEFQQNYWKKIGDYNVKVLKGRSGFSIGGLLKSVAIGAISGGIGAFAGLGTVAAGAFGGAVSGGVSGGFDGALKGAVLGGLGGAASLKISGGGSTAANAGLPIPSTGEFGSIAGTGGSASAAYTSGLLKAGLPIVDNLAVSFGTSLTQAGAAKAGLPNAKPSQPNALYNDTPLAKAAQSGGANAPTGGNDAIGAVKQGAIDAAKKGIVGEAGKLIAGKLLAGAASSSAPALNSTVSTGAPTALAATDRTKLRKELIGARGTRRIFAGRGRFASDLFNTKLKRVA